MLRSPRATSTAPMTLDDGVTLFFAHAPSITYEAAKPPMTQPIAQTMP